jgi:hypothetical protein
MKIEYKGFVITIDKVSKRISTTSHNEKCNSVLSKKL